MALHQKRMLAFINHFVIKTVQFLNNFAYECETKLINYEMKMQKIEASLKILETKLSSIPDVKQSLKDDVVEVLENASKETSVEIADNTEQPTQPKSHDLSENITVPVQRDPKYDRFFKMVQVGVPAQAVKLKMIQEGLDPSILDSN